VDNILSFCRKKPEYEDNYDLLEDQLNCILQGEDYDPRQDGTDIHSDISLLDRNMNSQPFGSEDNNISQEINKKSLRINSEVKDNIKLEEETGKEELDNSPTFSMDANENLDRLSLSDKEKSDKSEESYTISAISTRATSVEVKRRPRMYTITINFGLILL
jgi:hypothetical protein